MFIQEPCQVKQWLFRLFWLGLLVSFPAESKVPKEGHCHLRMVWGSWPPYQYLDHKGKPTGQQIDLINQIARLAGCTLTFKKQSFHQNIASIQEGKADIMADITPTASRSKFAYFSTPYREENLVLYVRRSFLPRCKDGDLAQLIKNGFRLGLTKGNWYGETVAQLLRDKSIISNIQYLELNDMGAEYLFKGKIDGFFEDPLVMAYKIRQHQQSSNIASCKIVVSGGEVSLMFSKKTVSPEIVEDFNRAIQTIKNTETYKRRWSWEF